MMKKIFVMMVIMMMMVSLSACGGRLSERQDSDSLSHTESETLSRESDSLTDTGQQPQKVPSSHQESQSIKEPLETEEEDNMSDMEILVGNQTFSVTLYDNETVKAFRKLLPMTLNMSELNGNEKYYYLSGSLPANFGRLPGIHTGDLMLYGDNCLVLFYESFSTSYSYTTIGYVENPDGLAAVLGSGDVQITFRMK